MQFRACKGGNTLSETLFVSSEIFIVVREVKVKLCGMKVTQIQS